MKTQESMVESFVLIKHICKDYNGKIEVRNNTSETAKPKRNVQALFLNLKENQQAKNKSGQKLKDEKLQKNLTKEQRIL